MDCDVAREALSARIDGEREPVPARRVDEHLADCQRCRQWYFGVRDETRRLRELAGRPRPPVATVPVPPGPRRRRGAGVLAWRWALGAVGMLQSVLAFLQAAGIDMGAHAGEGLPMTGVHLLNESTAWSLALGAAMMLTALWPAAAAGLSAVLVSFTAVLTAYVIADAASSAVTGLRALSHLPILVGTVMALMVWRRTAGPKPGRGPEHSADPAQITLPHNASRGKLRGHLWPTDDSAA